MRISDWSSDVCSSDLDRSPCGTGTSAKLACLAADGKLAPGQIWRQAIIIGSEFEASYVREGETIIPTLHGRAHISAQGTLILQDDDPFRWRSEEHTSELQSLMRISYAVFCLNKKKNVHIC